MRFAERCASKAREATKAASSRVADSGEFPVEHAAVAREGAASGVVGHDHLVGAGPGERAQLRLVVFNDDMLTRREEIMRDVCQSFDAELRECNGEGDHVHLFVHYPPKIALSTLGNSLKGFSAPLPACGVQQPGQPDRDGPGALVPVLLRRILR